MAAFTMNPTSGTAGRVANGLDAIQQAIQMYMGLRQQKVVNQREAQDQDLRRQQLAIQQQDAAERQGEGEEKGLQYLIGNFGGSEVSPGAAALLKRHPEYYSATEAERTLPARGGSFAAPPATAPAGAVGPGPQLGAPQPQDLPSTPTGRTLFRTPQDARERIAYFTALSRAAEGDANRASRERVAGMAATTADKNRAASTAIAQARIAMQKYGIDERSVQAQRMMDDLDQRFNAAQTNDELDTLIRLYSNPLYALGVGTPPAPTPRGAVGPLAPPSTGGTGRFTPLP